MELEKLLERLTDILDKQDELDERIYKVLTKLSTTNLN